jgi:hypothetical protein
MRAWTVVHRAEGVDFSCGRVVGFVAVGTLAGAASGRPYERKRTASDATDGSFAERTGGWNCGGCYISGGASPAPTDRQEAGKAVEGLFQISDLKFQRRAKRAAHRV